MALFGKPKYTIVRIAKRKEIPGGLWTKCEECGEIIFNKTLEENLKVCPKCNFHFTLTAHERIAQLLDGNSFREEDAELAPADPLQFKGPKSYLEKLKQDQEATGLKDAAISATGALDGKKLVIVVTDSRFIMGTLGSVVGEKIARAAERAMKEKMPLIIVSGSGGGARMYEGALSLMQMAKTSAAIAKFRGAGGIYISVLTNPTMAGVMASFASLGDIVLAEPKALLGFTGPRVIEQTIRQKLPDGFQSSEFMLEHGMLDMIVPRKNLKSTVIKLLEYLT